MVFLENMSKSLLKLLDTSLFPACVMILAKLFGVLAVLWFFNIPYTLRDYFSNVYSLRFIISEENIQNVTAYSDLIMYLIIAMLFSINIVRAIFLHSTHISPSMMNRLANRNLLRLVQSSYEIYHSATIWLIFLWVSNILVLINVFSGVSLLWVGVVSFLLSIFLTAILLQDVYREIENIKNKPNKYLLA